MGDKSTHEVLHVFGGSSLPLIELQSYDEAIVSFVGFNHNRKAFALMKQAALVRSDKCESANVSIVTLGPRREAAIKCNLLNLSKRTVDVEVGYPLEWIGVLEKIRAFRYAVLIPGHGVPETNTAYIDHLIATLTALNEQVRVLVSNGADLQATQQRVDVRSLARQLVSSAPPYAPIDWHSVIACSYAEIKHIPIIQGKPCGETKGAGTAQ